VKLVRKISTFFMDPAADVSQQSLFLLATAPMKSILKLCPQAVLQQLYCGATAASTAHWLTDTKHFASDLTTALVALDGTLAQSSCDAADTQRRNMWAHIIEITRGDIGYTT
jgi:hypothetical protein